MRKPWQLIAAATCCGFAALSLNVQAGDDTLTNSTTGGAGGAGGSASGGSATGGVANGGSAANTNAQSSNSAQTNAQNINITNTNPPDSTSNINYSGSYKLKNTPDVSLGGPASGPCNGFSGGLGVSTPGFAVGANTSTVDRGCEARETARVAAMLGRMDIANAVLENISLVQDALQAQAQRTKQQGQAFNPVTSPTASADQKKRMKAQRDASIATIKRQNTMNSATETLRFTTLATQGDEKTDQQKMWDEAMGIKPEAATATASAPASKPQPTAAAATPAVQDPNAAAPVAGNSAPANGGSAPVSPNNDAGLSNGNAPQQGAVSSPTGTPVSGTTPAGPQQGGQPQAAAAAAFVSHR
jgi:hypothetical protein